MVVSEGRILSLSFSLSQPSTKVGGKSGVIHGTELIELFAHAQQKGYGKWGATEVILAPPTVNEDPY